jgi:hypothetical protein
MTKTKFNQRQEVLAISLANIFSGLFGGIPATAALARTALNIKCGATSRVSGIISAFTVILLSLIFLPYFKFLPLPNIAAILVNVAIRMIEVEEIKLIYSNKVPPTLASLLQSQACLREPRNYETLWLSTPINPCRSTRIYYMLDPGNQLALADMLEAARPCPTRRRLQFTPMFTVNFTPFSVQPALHLLHTCL